MVRRDGDDLLNRAGPCAATPGATPGTTPWTGAGKPRWSLSPTVKKSASAYSPSPTCRSSVSVRATAKSQVLSTIDAFNDSRVFL